MSYTSGWTVLRNKIWRYQRCNQKPYFEGQKIQLSKEKGQTDCLETLWLGNANPTDKKKRRWIQLFWKDKQCLRHWLHLSCYSTQNSWKRKSLKIRVEGTFQVNL